MSTLLNIKSMFELCLYLVSTAHRLYANHKEVQLPNASKFPLTGTASLHNEKQQGGK